MNPTMNFCQNLRHLRMVYNLSQQEMAAILGVSTGTLGRIERCAPNVRIHAEMLYRVCVHFDRSADELLFENWSEMITKTTADS